MHGERRQSFAFNAFLPPGVSLQYASSRVYCWECCFVVQTNTGPLPFTWLKPYSSKDRNMPRRFCWFAPAVLVSVALLMSARADDSPKGPAGQKARADVATCLKIEGALLQRGKDGKFNAVKTGDRIPPGALLIGFPEADLVSSCGKIQIHFHLHIGEILPITEAAIVLNDSPMLNADITLDRGVIGIRGLADKGETVVRVRGPERQVWELTLKDPDTKVLVARFGRHEPGTKLFKTSGKKVFLDEPLMHMGVLAVKGRVVVNTGSASYALNAPPGPALITWDSHVGHVVKQMDKLPDAVSDLAADQQKAFKEVCEMTGKLAAGDLGKGLDELLATDGWRQHRVAVACMGALDDVPRLVAALENQKSADVRDHAILVLRNWIGREPGQLTKLYSYLTKEKKYTPAQGRTVVQLLRGFDDADRKEPRIYQLLIDGLEVSPLLSIRELANWHLQRLAPAGQKIVYDAAGDQESRSKAATEWRRLIPDGQLPPPPPKKEKK
jgi:hypothetical protein